MPANPPNVDVPAISAAITAQYWRYVPLDERAGRSSDELKDTVVRHVEFAAVRGVNETLLQVDEGANSVGVITLVTTDMPFLVDSITNELTRLGVSIRLFVHPQLVVERDAGGVLQLAHADTDPDNAGTGQFAESWMRIEVEGPAAVSADDIDTNLRRVLADVGDTVADWEPMRAKALAIADELSVADLPVPDKDVSDSQELLRWLVDDHFTFLGYREYQLVKGVNGDMLEAVTGTGLGILRGDQAEPRSISQMPAEVRQHLLEKRLLIITKANSRSTVHHPAYMDYIGFKVFDAAGNVVGERRFLGLFSSTAYLESVRKLPVVSRKVEEVIARSGLSPRSHSGRDLLHTLETYPRDELFQIRTEELYLTVTEILRLTSKRALRLFVRKDLYGRFVSCLVYLPRDRYTTRSRLVMQEILMEALHGVGVDYTARVSERKQARVRFVVRVDPQAEIGEIDVPALQTRLAEATRLWEEDFADALDEAFPATARDLISRYGTAFSEGYKAERSPRVAVSDVTRLEDLTEPGAISVRLYGGDTSGELRFTIYHRGEVMPLSAVLPVLHSLGVSVIDERPYHIAVGGRASSNSETVSIYNYGLSVKSDMQPQLTDAAVARGFEDAFVAAWRGVTETDGLNALVLKAGLRWDQVLVLRAYARYLRQAGIRYSQGYVEKALTSHPAIAAELIALFDAEFNPDIKDHDAVAHEVLDRLKAALGDVASLDEDRIIRSFMTLMTATLRTNHYQLGADGRRKSYVSLKLDPQQIPDLPLPRPKFEIFVYSPRIEGVHLRFGPVARGGLRWSDRLEDFRTEILGLVKAQMVKNAIIVPTGSKGGFVVKKPPVGGDRTALLEEGIACYKLFISGLLDITDNLVSGAVVPPSQVVRRDGDDPYLVVAADKGTATFSDIANGVATDYGFWLGDAFASGGSVGYDHKKMGITARGAWESVKRHFRQLDVDTQKQNITVVGIGDMSGDVFGNGMLLSDHIRLVAAFDHRHIFIDPNPDAASSFVERQRLFELPTSSWDSYDRSLISAGGAVYPRDLKEITLSDEAKVALGLAPETGPLSPPEVISAILKAPVDLLWNGGIGTYVRATSETDAEVGDKANDSLRVTGSQLRCRVVGEGGNLGFTQRGRIEFALAGGHINTDAIDNSAGVDTSDHEVNMKILFGQAIEAGEITVADRDEMMVAATDEVADLVLRNNYDQNAALMTGTTLSPKLFSVHQRLMSELERSGRLNRAIEFLPSVEECAEREAAGQGLTQPELSVLLAYVKISLKEDMLASSLPDDPWCDTALTEYFPTPLRERFHKYMKSHPLRREIIATVLTNEVVDSGGITFVHRAIEETGASSIDVVRAYFVIREVFGLLDRWDVNEHLDTKVPSSAQIAVEAKLRRVIDRGVRWLLQARGGTIDIGAEVVRLRDGVAELLPLVPNLVVEQEKEALAQYTDELTATGLPREFAADTAIALHGFGTLDVVELARKRGAAPLDVAKVYYTVSARFHMEELFAMVTNLPRHDRWTALARMAVRYDLYAVLAGITNEVLERAGGRTEPANELVDEWMDANRVRIERVQTTLDMLGADSASDLATLSVLLRQMRSMMQS